MIAIFMLDFEQNTHAAVLVIVVARVACSAPRARRATQATETPKYTNTGRGCPESPGR